MRRFVETLQASPEQVVMWCSVFLLAAVLGLGASLAVWIHLPPSASQSMLRLSVLFLGAGFLLVAVGLRAATARLIFAGLGVGIAFSGGLAAIALATP